MRCKGVLSIVTVALVFTACEGTAPTDVTETGLTPAGGGATRTELQQDIDFGWFVEFFPCINDGQGEVVDARFHFLFDWVITNTPSGKEIWQGKVTYHPDTRLIGHETGDVWLPTRATRQNRVIIDDVDGDGVYVAHNNTHEVWMNQDREKMHSMLTFQVVVDPSGTIRLLPRGWREVCPGPN
jgi:hypothetical protein